MLGRVETGANDWTAFHELKACTVDQLARLAKLREMFFPEGSSPGRRSITVGNLSRDPQSAKFRENLAWTVNGIHFTTLHIAGSNDNKGHNAAMDAGHGERTRANIAWMKKGIRRRQGERQLRNGANHPDQSRL